jgi:hypothetical protein
MDDQVLLCIEGGKFVLSPEEAMQICHILNGANRITTAWMRSTSKSEEIIGEPSITASSIVPIPAHYRIRLDANERQRQAEK